MKKLLLLLILTLLPKLNGSAQTEKSDSVFSSSAFEKDRKEWKALAKKYDYNDWRWANKASKQFPLNPDGAIECTYVIYGSRSIGVPELKDLCVKWFDISFVRAKNVVEDIGDNYIKAHGIYSNIVNFKWLTSTVSIDAPVDVNIYIKDNRVKIQLVVQHYEMVSSSTFNGGESGVNNISSCYPFNRKSNHKDSYSSAYVNVYTDNLDKIDSFIKYLNIHTKGPIISPLEGW